MDRDLEEPDGRLTLDEVREGAPDLGWTLIRDQYHHVSKEDAEGRCSVPAGLYRVLVFESESPQMTLTTYFDPDTPEMLGMQYEHHLMRGIIMTVPNTDDTIPSPKFVRRVLAIWVEWFSDLAEAERRKHQDQTDTDELP